MVADWLAVREEVAALAPEVGGAVAVVADGQVGPQVDEHPLGLLERPDPDRVVEADAHGDDAAGRGDRQRHHVGDVRGERGGDRHAVAAADPDADPAGPRVRVVWTSGSRNSSTVAKPTSSGTRRHRPRCRARGHQLERAAEGSDSSGAETSGQFSNAPWRPSGRVVPGGAEGGEHDLAGGVGAGDPDLVGAVAGRQHLHVDEISSPGGAVDTNCVVIHSARRSVTSSAAVIDTAMAVPP